MPTVECQDSTQKELATLCTHILRLGWKMWTGASVCGWQICLAAVTLHSHILGVSHLDCLSVKFERLYLHTA